MGSYARVRNRNYDYVVLLNTLGFRSGTDSKNQGRHVGTINLRALQHPADGSLARGQAIEALNAALEGIGSGSEE